MSKKRSFSCAIEQLERRQLLSFGQPIDNFGVGGKVSVDFATSTNAPAELLVGSRGGFASVSDAGIARVTAAGKLDSTFGTSGKQALSGLAVRDAAIDSSGKIVILAAGSSG